MSQIDSPANSFPTEENLDEIVRGIPSAFEKLITDQPPILQSLIAQLPTQSILALFHTSSYLNTFLKNSPTSWRYVSWRLYQPAQTTVNAAPTNNANGTSPRQSSNYALDQLLLDVIHPFSTRLASLEVDNTAVSGATIFEMVMVLRKDTMEHVSVRGCKNVSLKYHINPWLAMHAMALDRPQDRRSTRYGKLALKSLYTYRCRHHRRRPYLPNSLARKESDSEPTHELVSTCHKLGIWTDTAWCTTPGTRCFRRKGYVTMRLPQDTREVWVVYDRLWRSRNWLGPLPPPENRSQAPENRSQSMPTVSLQKRKRDCRIWEFDEEAMDGESIATKGDGKTVPAHLRKTHKQFVDDIYCDNCSDPILERCEQCSVMMHCSGCRKTLCASCAFDRPYLRNKMAPAEEKNRFWWAPGCAVSPCAMQDQDPFPPGPAGNNQQTPNASAPPSIKFRWCCLEPQFSGGGGITFNNAPQSRELDKIRAAPLPAGEGWEDPEFSHHTCATSSIESDEIGQIGVPLTRSDGKNGPGGRWPSIDSLFQKAWEPHSNAPRILCEDCYQSDQWKIKCKACSMALCLKHDVRDRLKVRICGYKDLVVEKAEYEARQKALRLLTMVMLRRRKNKMKMIQDKGSVLVESASAGGLDGTTRAPTGDKIQEEIENGMETPRPTRAHQLLDVISAELDAVRSHTNSSILDRESSNRPVSPGSNSTGPSTRASSPAPSSRSILITPEPSSLARQQGIPSENRPVWQGCQSFFCPGIRPQFDHRRRCIAVMRQCQDCKIFVCEQCTSGLEAPCPCRGCRLQNEDNQDENPTEATLRFFCPNCRWSRMLSRKCKRKPASTTRKGSLKRKDKRRLKKPLTDRKSFRRAGVPTGTEASVREMTDGLVEFFEGLQIEEPPTQVPGPTPEMNESNPPGPGEEIRELEDMGALARDLIRRIQTLRQQFGPNSLAAQALPDIRVDDNGNVQQHLQTQSQPLSQPNEAPEQIVDVEEPPETQQQEEEEEEQQVLPDGNARDSSSESGN